MCLDPDHLAQLGLAAGSSSTAVLPQAAASAPPRSCLLLALRTSDVLSQLCCPTANAYLAPLFFCNLKQLHPSLNIDTVVISTMFLQLKLIYFKGNVLKQEGIQHKGKNRMLNPYCSTTETLVAGCGMRCSPLLPWCQLGAFSSFTGELVEDRAQEGTKWGAFGSPPSNCTVFSK